MFKAPRTPRRYQTAFALSLRLHKHKRHKMFGLTVHSQLILHVFVIIPVKMYHLGLQKDLCQADYKHSEMFKI